MNEKQQFQQNRFSLIAKTIIETHLTILLTFTLKPLLEWHNQLVKKCNKCYSNSTTHVHFVEAPQEFFAKSTESWLTENFGDEFVPVELVNSGIGNCQLCDAQSFGLWLTLTVE